MSHILTCTVRSEAEVELTDEQIQQIVERYLRIHHGWRPGMQVHKGRVVTVRSGTYSRETGLINGRMIPSNLDDHGKVTASLSAAITIMDQMHAANPPPEYVDKAVGTYRG